MKPQFPVITALADQALGAAQLKSYKTAIEFLLGLSHATFSCEYCGKASVDVYQGDYQTIREWYMEHVTETLYRKLWVATDYGNAVDREWSYVIQVYKTDTWIDVVEESGTNNAYEEKSGTTDITAHALTVGTAYHWRLRVKVSVQGEPEDCHVKCIPWSIRENGAVAGWQAPHTFTADTSDKAHFNDWRTDLLALKAAISPIGIPSANPEQMTVTAEPGNWEVYDHWCYRYRPESLQIVIQGSQQVSTGEDDRWWRFRVLFQDDTTPAPKEAVIYTGEEQDGQGHDNFTWDNQVIDLTSGDAATALTAAGITLTLGNWYRIIIECDRGVNDQVALIRHVFVLRVSDGTPDGSWTAMNSWAHGDTDLGPTELNKYSADLVLLYSGAEADFRQTIATCVGYGASPMGYTFIHRKRWLHYLAPDSIIMFWPYERAETHSPPTGDDWQVFDLDSIDVLYGSIYFVEGAISCYESDEV